MNETHPYNESGKALSTIVDEKKNLNELIDFFYLCLRNWKWFIISTVVCLSLVFFYLKTVTPIYTRTAIVHIKNEAQQSSIGNISDEFSDLGLSTTGGSVSNEVVAFNSPELAEQVVRKLRLDYNYQVKMGLRKQSLFGKSLPIDVDFATLTDDDQLSLNVRLLPSNKIQLGKLIFNNQETELEQEVAFNQPVETPAGRVTFIRTNPTLPLEEMEITITHSDISTAINQLQQRLQIKQNNPKNDVIDIICNDESIERAEVTISTLIDEYNKNWMKDKNELGVLTSQFIEERINVIQKELGNVDSDISSYKSNNLLTDQEQTISLYMSQANATDQQLMTLNNQIYMCKYLLDYMAKNANDGKLIPANIGIQSTVINTLISEFNQKMLTRNTYVNNSSEQNPIVQSLDEELAAQRGIIMQSLRNEQRSLETQIASSKSSIAKSTSRLSSSPTQQKNLLSMDRQQKVKESLYLFLLQKREENELSQAFTAYNTRIISRPMGLNQPASPRPMRSLAIAFVVSLIIPIICLYLRELFNTKVRGRKDLEKMSVPFVGEVPQHRANRGRQWLFFHFHEKEKKEVQVVVEQGNRNIINESFRMVRSNLLFMLNQRGDKKEQVVLVTSAHPNSGKTFISINLAKAFSIQKDTRVAVVDLDIRKATLSEMVGKPAVGITDYLGGHTDSWQPLMVKYQESNHLDLLPVGRIPPNPTELLQGTRIQQLIDAMRKEYDIIIIDLPPAEVVADVSIVKTLADLTLYVLRAGLTDRTMLGIIENYYQEKYFNNLSILLNGTDIQRHGHYGYGYNYGYHSAYGQS